MVNLVRSMGSDHNIQFNVAGSSHLSNVSTITLEGGLPKEKLKDDERFKIDLNHTCDTIRNQFKIRNVEILEVETRFLQKSNDPPKTSVSIKVSYRSNKWPHI